MEHKGTVTLETDRLILRQFCLSDAEAMYDNWANDPEVTKYLTWPTHKDIKISQEYIKSLLSSYKSNDNYDWGIELKEIGQVIGSIGVVHANFEIGSVHIGYCIGRNWWNKGITSEAFARVIRFLMEDVKVNRIECRHDTLNINSGKVMKKCGLQYEGTLRQSDTNNQGICDAMWYGLLREDYLNS